MYRRCLQTVCFLSLVQLPTAVIAQDYNHYKNRRVMIIKWDTEARSREGVVRKLDLGNVYEVTRVNGSWLWFNGGVGGWVRAGDVVLYEQAIDHFNGLLQRDPSSANYFHRAVAWSAKGELDIALGDYNESIRRDADRMVYNGRGSAWSDKKEYDKAIADYEEAIRLDPKFASAYYNRGNAWGGKKEYDKAIADYNEAIQLNPKFASAYHNRGNTWEIKGNYDKAIADYNEAIRLDSNYATGYNGLAWVLATCPEKRFRDGQQAVKYATKACQLDGWKDEGKIDTLAATYAESGDFKQAVKWQTKTLELAPASKKSGYRESLRLYQSGKPYRTKPVR